MSVRLFQAALEALAAQDPTNPSVKVRNVTAEVLTQQPAAVPSTVISQAALELIKFYEMPAATRVAIGGAWRQALTYNILVGGQWKCISKIHIVDGGAWLGL